MEENADFSLQMYVAVSWLSVILMGIGLVAVVLHARLSRWMWLVAGGLALMIGSGILGRLTLRMLEVGPIPASKFVQLLQSWTYLQFLAWVFLVSGLVGVFRDWSRQLQSHAALTDAMREAQ